MYCVIIVSWGWVSKCLFETVEGNSSVCEGLRIHLRGYLYMLTFLIKQITSMRFNSKTIMGK